jgi:ribosomal protein S18 acetylase RimI-like enzyme
MIVVREITVDDWELLREVRLAALAEAPQAFASTHAGESALTEEQWRGRISERSVMFFARQDSDGSAPLGLAGVYIQDADANLVSMWVRPSGRGLGVGEALVQAAASWAKEHDCPAMFLWVTESNAPAVRLYERCGFTPTGERQPLPSDPTLPEIRMRRKLLAGPGR